MLGRLTSFRDLINTETEVAELYGSIAIATGSAALITTTFFATQLVLTPENVWVPVGVAFTVVSGLVSLAIWSTMRAVRVFDRLTRNQRKIMKELGMQED